MAKVKLPSYIKSIHGKRGNIIYYNVRGIQYSRSWSMPENPRTPLQQQNRRNFSESVKLWQSLDPEEKKTYNDMAAPLGRKGYNLFISMQMDGPVAASKAITCAKSAIISPITYPVKSKKNQSPPLSLRHLCNRGTYNVLKGYEQMPRAA
ncbi:MAG: hypothetical protein GXY14_05260 [Spirochaetes bacterium]|nr:hypothetical protein [Spirochaetota bacterium]